MNEEEILKCPKCGEELTRLPTRVQRELGFLLLGVVFGAALGIVGNLWVAFLFELVKILIPQETWALSTFLGLIITTVASIYILLRTMRTAVKYTTGEERLRELGLAAEKMNEKNE